MKAKLILAAVVLTITAILAGAGAAAVGALALIPILITHLDEADIDLSKPPLSVIRAELANTVAANCELAKISNTLCNQIDSYAGLKNGRRRVLLSTRLGDSFESLSRDADRTFESRVRRIYYYIISAAGNRNVVVPQEVNELLHRNEMLINRMSELIFEIASLDSLAETADAEARISDITLSINKLHKEVL